MGDRESRMTASAGNWWLCERCHYSMLRPPGSPAPICPECHAASQIEGDRLTEVERMLEARVERHYSTSYETDGIYVLSESEMDAFIEYAISLIAGGA